LLHGNADCDTLWCTGNTWRGKTAGYATTSWLSNPLALPSSDSTGTVRHLNPMTLVLLRRRARLRQPSRFSGLTGA